MGRYLLTGVTRGIGRELSRQLIELGHQVFGIVRPGTDVDDLGLTGHGEADLATPESVAAALSDLVGSIDSLDGLVHSAGIVRGGAIEETSPDDFASQFAVNVTAAAEITRVFLPALRAAGGTVVFVNSTSGLSAHSPLAAYGASKFAARAYADALREDELQLRVTTVYPSRTATDMQRELRAIEKADYNEDNYLQPSTVAGVIVSVLTLPTDGVITELAVRPRPRA